MFDLETDGDIQGDSTAQVIDDEDTQSRANEARQLVNKMVTLGTPDTVEEGRHLKEELAVAIGSENEDTELDRIIAGARSTIETEGYL